MSAKKWKINCCFNLKQEATKQISDENNWVGRPRCALPHFHNFCSTYIFMTERRENVLIALYLRLRSGRLLDLKVQVECFASATVYLVSYVARTATARSSHQQTSLIFIYLNFVSFVCSPFLNFALWVFINLSEELLLRVVNCEEFIIISLFEYNLQIRLFILWTPGIYNLINFAVQITRDKHP